MLGGEGGGPAEQLFVPGVGRAAPGLPEKGRFEEAQVGRWGTVRGPAEQLCVPGVGRAVPGAAGER
eukprot:362907-Chlamydomonas_euryale.AAC.18